MQCCCQGRVDFNTWELKEKTCKGCRLSKRPCLGILSRNLCKKGTRAKCELCHKEMRGLLVRMNHHEKCSSEGNNFVNMSDLDLIWISWLVNLFLHHSQILVTMPYRASK